jgi:hypothetical protein
MEAPTFPVTARQGTALGFDDLIILILNARMVANYPELFHGNN